MRSLSVRGTLPGQVISHSVRDDPPDFSLSRSCVILIHGYQNSVEKATNSYEAFQKVLRRSSVGGSLGSRIGDVWGFYWPGDHHNWAVNLATYHARVPLAAQSGERLAEFLQSRTRPTQEVHLVAHSLGCRVVLETVAAIKRLSTDYHGDRIWKILLFAAAVPEIFCTDEYPFSSMLPKSEEHVFWSCKDKALGIAFDNGQALLGEAGRAVGLYGGPEGRWHSPKPSSDLGHGQYWRSKKIARLVARIFGAAADRRIEGRSLVDAAEDLPSWERSRRTLPAHRLPRKE